MRRATKHYGWAVALLSSLLLLTGLTHRAEAFTFALNADNHSHTDDGHDLGVACQRISQLGAAFLTTAGDMHSQLATISGLDGTLATTAQEPGKSYLWYPVAGNHDMDNLSNMQRLRDYNPGGTSLPYVVNGGPPNGEETIYSWDYENAHFVAINLYYDGETDYGFRWVNGEPQGGGHVGDALYDWLAADLAATAQEHVFVIGHEPMWPHADLDDGGAAYQSPSIDSTEERDRFWDLLAQHGVLAYLCGHYHSYFVGQEQGVWHVQTGHSKGDDNSDDQRRSTFMLLHVNGGSVTFDTYRTPTYDVDGPYELYDSGTLASGPAPGDGGGGASGTAEGGAGAAGHGGGMHAAGATPSTAGASSAADGTLNGACACRLAQTGPAHRAKGWLLLLVCVLARRARRRGRVSTCA